MYQIHFTSLMQSKRRVFFAVRSVNVNLLQNVWKMRKIWIKIAIREKSRHFEKFLHAIKTLRDRIHYGNAPH